MAAYQESACFEFAPEIADSTGSIVAGDVGGSVRLVCRAEGVPSVSFSWSPRGDPRRFLSRESHVGTTLWEGELEITGLEPSDLGNYSCMARNEMGRAESSVLLRLKGRRQFRYHPYSVYPVFI
ncbi:HMCN1 [Cordylochernes scorpioides]|uniref:HMCN1 n=1 Tax=Cordylochernes scorpioides TaxID=51811 RepID=A0ABY6LQ20_9ARAC|nr:HMCN1 [Cordylochernes scorpioides]